MAQTHRLTVDAGTDVVSWKAIASFAGSDYILTHARPTDVNAWLTVDQVIALGAGGDISEPGIDSATDEITFVDIT